MDQCRKVLNFSFSYFIAIFTQATLGDVFILFCNAVAFEIIIPFEKIFRARVQSTLKMFFMHRFLVIFFSSQNREENLSFTIAITFYHSIMQYNAEYTFLGLFNFLNFFSHLRMYSSAYVPSIPSYCCVKIHVIDLENCFSC